MIDSYFFIYKTIQNDHYMNVQCDIVVFSYTTVQLDLKCTHELRVFPFYFPCCCCAIFASSQS